VEYPNAGQSSLTEDGTEVFISKKSKARLSLETIDQTWKPKE